MLIYIDNMIVCARDKHDLVKEEQEAIDSLWQLDSEHRIRMVGSRISAQNIEQAKDSATLQKLKVIYETLNRVAKERKIRGFSELRDQYGGQICNPIPTEILDRNIFSQLCSIGLDADDDARHLTIAICNKADIFLTTDPDYLDRRSLIEERYPGIRVLRPSELKIELI